MVYRNEHNCDRDCTRLVAYVRIEGKWEKIGNYGSECKKFEVLDLAVTGLRNIASAKGITIAASRLGKLKMVGQSVTIVLLILGREVLGPAGVLMPLALWASVALAFVSMGQYFVRFSRDAGFD